MQVFRHEPYDETVDVYSFAMILYNLMAGHAPWPNKNGVKAVKCAAIDNTRPMVPRHWDAVLSNLMVECWSEDPRKRPHFTHILETLQMLHEKRFKMSVDEKTSNEILGGGVGCKCTIQ